MATAAQVIKAALQRILVQASEAELQPEEYSDAIFAMNNLVEGYEADGLVLGWTTVTSLSDTLTIDDGAVRGLISNLAIELAPDYGGEVDAALVKQAADGMRTIEKIGVTITAATNPSTLPKGSGNYSGWPNDDFYPGANTDA